MIDQLVLQDVLKEYKATGFLNRWKDEKFKWEAVQNFQKNWNINADDFAEMLDTSLQNTYGLLSSYNNFPRAMIIDYAHKDPEHIRTMFKNLFDEAKDVYKRISEFKKEADIVLKLYSDPGEHHYQHENAISTYLWLKYPDKYYIYKYNVAKKVAVCLKSNYTIKQGDFLNNLNNGFSLYNEIRSILEKDQKIQEMLRSCLTENCYNDYHLNTLTIDFCYYISKYYKKQSIKPYQFCRLSEREVNTTINKIEKNVINAMNGGNYWLLNANPKIWSFANIQIGTEQSYTLYNENGHKRRIFQNFLDARAGDMVIGYESTPVKQVVAIAQISKENDGKKLYFKKLEGLVSPIDYDALKQMPELQKMEYFSGSQGSLFKLTSEEYDCIMDLIREENPKMDFKLEERYTKDDFLSDVFMSENHYDQLVSVLRYKKNIILQGAPGVGKTYAARRLAYSMMGEKDESRIEFVQFHQNYSYEDFVMGYKPEEDTFKLKTGVFYNFCKKAENDADRDYFFIIDEINRGNMSKIFGELLMLIENDHRGEKVTLAYSGMKFTVPKNLYIIGMMNTADRSLAMIDYALRRRFSFFNFEPGFDTDGFKKYQQELNNTTFDKLIDHIQNLNTRIQEDTALGSGFCIGHSYFCNQNECTESWMRSIVEYDILPMIREYWFDEPTEISTWENDLRGVFE